MKAMHRPFRFDERGAASAIAVAMLVGKASAIAVIPPTFPELVAEARTVFVGRVTSSLSQWSGSGAGRTIVTDVTFAVESVLKGDSEPTRILRFLGGTVDDQTLRIPGVPRFATGDRAVLFVTGQTGTISPLVGVMHGRFPVHRAPDGADYVTFHDGRTLSSIAQVGSASVVASRTMLRPMRREDFEHEILLEAERSIRR
jgi:hypothetical protein